MRVHGATGEATVVIEVVDAAGAIGHVVDQIDELLETATDSSLVAALTAARDSLTGNVEGGAANGALDRLDAEDLEAPLVHLTSGGPGRRAPEFDRRGAGRRLSDGSHL